MIGAIVGNYRILEKLGEGGMGAVFRGLDLTLEREVAIKMLRQDLSEQPHLIERFRAEAITLARLNHPNIAMLFNFFQQGNNFFMVLEYVRGQTLNVLMSQSGGVAYARALTLVDQMLDGLVHAHQLNVIHRDLKPSNLMVTGAGAMKITDFGIARMLGTARMTRTGGLVGTLEYMSPERVRGHEADARSDLYSAGILLYELLTGHVPFHYDSDYELMRAQVESPPPPPHVWLPDLPDAIERVILRALEKAPGERFQSAAEMRFALQQASLARHAASPSHHESPQRDTPTEVVIPSLETNRLEPQLVAQLLPPSQAPTLLELTPPPNLEIIPLAQPAQPAEPAQPAQAEANVPATQLTSVPTTQMMSVPTTQIMSVPTSQVETGLLPNAELSLPPTAGALSVATPAPPHELPSQFALPDEPAWLPLTERELEQRPVAVAAVAPPLDLSLRDEESRAVAVASASALGGLKGKHYLALAAGLALLVIIALLVMLRSKPAPPLPVSTSAEVSATPTPAPAASPNVSPASAAASPVGAASPPQTATPVAKAPPKPGKDAAALEKERRRQELLRLLQQKDQ